MTPNNSTELYDVTLRLKNLQDLNDLGSHWSVLDWIQSVTASATVKVALPSIRQDGRRVWLLRLLRALNQPLSNLFIPHLG